jgi:hypothetical protein
MSGEDRERHPEDLERLAGLEAQFWGAAEPRIDPRPPTDALRAEIFRTWVERSCPERSKAQALTYRDAHGTRTWTARRVLELAAPISADVPDDLCELLELPRGVSYRQAAGVLWKRRGYR